MSTGARLGLTLLLLASGACSSSGAPTSPAGTDTGSTDDTQVSGDATDDTVAINDTPGSCGNKVGDTLCDVSLDGYFRDGDATGLATDGARGSYKLSDVLAKGKQKYALIWSSAYW